MQGVRWAIIHGSLSVNHHLTVLLGLKLLSAICIITYVILPQLCGSDESKIHGGQGES